MPLNSSENIVLVAPRPVRLAAPTPYSQYTAASILHRPPTRSAVRFVSPAADAFDRLKLAEDIGDEDAKSEVSATSERDRSVSPRASPRSTLPSEAIEEFLSILRPSTFLFPPTSPILRPSNGTAHGIVSYRRPGSCTLSPAISSEGLGITFVDQTDGVARDGENVPYPFKIFSSGHLSSPVSRSLTRNPFPRQATIEDTVSTLISQRSSPVNVALSPAAIPLPLPTPDEMEHTPVL